MISALGIRCYAWILFIFFCSCSHTHDSGFQAITLPLPQTIATQVRQFSWHPGCPTPLENLAYLRLRHYGYDGRVQEGELIVHQELAEEVTEIFKTLFRIRFPIEKMRLVDAYGGKDDASMADNNTSAYNCREVTGRPGIFSQHAYGRAIDINPLVNPYVSNGTTKPPGGAAFLDHPKQGQGLLRADSLAIQPFIERGWSWGGNFKNLKDYQHFEKKKP